MSDAANNNNGQLCQFFVPGIPVPKGSGRAVWNKYSKKAVYLPDNTKTKDWQLDVQISAHKHRPASPHQGAVSVHLDFALPRPRSVSVKKRPHPTAKPDLDKLCRAILDALKGPIYLDDSSVIEVVARKRYASGDYPQGVVIVVSEYIGR